MWALWLDGTHMQAGGVGNRHARWVAGVGRDTQKRRGLRHR